MNIMVCDTFFVLGFSLPKEDCIDKMRYIQNAEIDICVISYDADRVVNRPASKHCVHRYHLLGFPVFRIQITETNIVALEETTRFFIGVDVLVRDRTAFDIIYKVIDQLKFIITVPQKILKLTEVPDQDH